MRKIFDRQLEKLNAELITMGALCEETINISAEALLTGNLDELPMVFAKDGEIDQKEREIENMCMRLLLQQQPVARDLRTIFQP